MLDNVFSSILPTTDGTVSSMSGTAFLICVLGSLLLGVIIAFIYMYKHDYSKSFVVTLALLPVIVAMVISLVNGNIGAGVAVMGVFNLVRFRSIPGSAKDIGAVFLAMAVGLACGMGFVVLAVIFTVIVGIANIMLVLSPLGGRLGDSEDKTLKISIPEDLDYSNVFDDLFARFTSTYRLESVKTTNMGSLYQLEYSMRLKNPAEEKELLDSIRCRNGNLTVSCSRYVEAQERL